MNKYNLTILTLLEIFIGCSNKPKFVNSSTINDTFIDKPIFEVVYDDSILNNKKPYIIIRNSYVDTLWALTSDFDKQLAPKLKVSFMQFYKDTIEESTEDFFMEGLPNEKLTPICPGNSVKLNSNYIEIEWLKLFKKNRIYYEFIYYIRKGLKYQIFSEISHYKIDSNKIKLYYNKIDSSRKSVEIDKLTYKPRSIGCINSDTIIKW